MPRRRIPKLPTLLDRKIYKTGQTRGADDDEIYQNRVARASTVLIPHSCWLVCDIASGGDAQYENGFIVLVSPDEYFGNPNITAELAANGLAIGANALVFYETRSQWGANNPETLNWRPASSRTNPLGGQYVARISATTASSEGEKIIRGFSVTAMKGAGIRVYEYASTATNQRCRWQLEALFWLCRDAGEIVVANGMLNRDAIIRKEAILSRCEEEGLLDTARLTESRMLNRHGATICPLCLEDFSSQGFFSRMDQAEGREVHDLTITQLNLFHIEELRFGILNHRPYNLGWGHHHCNVVVKDSGITETLEWMQGIVYRNVRDGYLSSANNPS